MTKRWPRVSSAKRDKLLLVNEEATWNEKHYMEVDVALLNIDAATRRIQKAIDNLGEWDAEPHLMEALERSRDELIETRRRLMQGTLFAVPKAQLTLQ